MMGLKKWIMSNCPYEWAKNEKNVEKSISQWLNDDTIWDCCETGGFKFARSKTGRRYIETIPRRKYID